ncbi:MAG: hypothetical protein K0Q73_8867 [Paenibacillus sp.]|nr:hypothetical protein [Paenibacillus sp.]
MTIPNVDNTTLNNLTPNLDIGDVADPALRLAAFQYIYAEMQTIVTDLNASQAAGTITTLKLADGSVVTAKLADGAVTGAKMADGTIVTIKLADGSITTAKIVAGAVGTTQLADLAVTQAKIANGAVGVNQLATGLAATVDVNAQFMKRALDVTSAPFSAKGDGVTDDSAAVNAAIDYANANGYTHVFLPSVHMIKGIIYLKSNITLYGNGECSELLFNEPIYRIVLDGVENVTLRDFKTSRFGYKPILIKNGSSNIRIQNIQFVSSYSDYCISTCISLETCSKITIDGCYFYRTGYQVLQEAGYVSNNVIVQNCISERCFQDFVELNSESSAISRNWIIRNNRVYDIGMYQTTDETTTFGYKVYHWTNTQITAPNVEGRFFGMTWCDNVLIEGNIVEGVGGDSAITRCKATTYRKGNKNSHSKTIRLYWIVALR